MNPRTAGRIKAVAGNLFALACLVWVFHDLGLRELREALHNLEWGWVPLAVALDVASYVAQGGRWGLLLRPLGRVSAYRTTSAIYAGLFVNEVLPLRAGELLRAHLIAKRLSTGMKAVFPSIAVERLLDGIWLAMAMVMVAAFVPLPADLLRAGDLLGVAVLLGLLVFVFLVMRKRREAGGNAEPARGLRGFLARQAEGIRSIGLGGRFWGAFALTSALLLLQGAAFWLVLLACRMHLSLPAGMAVFLIVHLGTAIPNAPGNVGSYQFFCVLGLALFGVEKAQAAAFSVVVFFVLSVPLWAFGYLALRGNGLSLRKARGLR